MFLAALVLALLILTTPAMLLFDGPIIHGLVIAAAAISVAIVAVRTRPGEAHFLLSLVRPLAIIAAFPAVWLLFQVLPLDAVGLANPIWESAAAALGQSLSGSVSIDPGATLIALARYLSLVGIAFVAAAVAINRKYAEGILYLVTATASLIGLVVCAISLRVFTFLSNSDGSAINAATDIACLGIIFAAASGFHTFERWKMQRLSQGRSTVWRALAFVASLAAIAICCLTVIVAATGEAYFAVTCGSATLAIAVVVRRFRLGPWGYSAIVSVALLVALAAIALQPGDRKMDLTLAFATRASASLIALTQRTLMETSWTGTGAGTYAAILPTYRGVDELAAGTIAPTAAAKIAVEMGRPFFWAILAAAIALATTLLRGASRRGRDSFYSAAGASCIVTIVLLAFGDVTVSSTPVLVTASVVVGIAIAQSKSRSI